MIELYGAPASSAGRTHLLLEEIGVPYNYHRVNLRDPATKAEFLKMNPSGRVPFLLDGDVVLQESIAINFYLAEKYAPQLWSTNAATRAQIYMWSLWAITNLQPEVMRVARHTMFIPADARSAYEVETGKSNTQSLLDELERGLTGSYLVGGTLTVADINVASVVNLVGPFQAGTAGAKTKAWLDGLKARPAWQNVAKGG
ncbi:MAG TPA: glutathione S-transferase family protein [Kofleriaceae bacterium]|nr:glutathione S-transferase family protein [Kofleriaceae bacterium]